MDTMSAFLMGEANRGKPSKVFDWDKAARILKENNVKNASAGLSGDWEYTGGEILEDGKIPDESYCYLASTWATPELHYNGSYEACYVMENETNWDSSTFWPESARNIFKGDGNE